MSVVINSVKKSGNVTVEDIKPTVKYGKITLKNGKDYKVDYGNVVNKGVGKVKITGVGNYGGVKNINFLIIPKALSWLLK